MEWLTAHISTIARAGRALLFSLLFLANAPTLAQESGGLEPTMIRIAPGGTFTECAICPKMVVVPGGVFEMGASDIPNAAPTAPVAVVPFALSVTEVTRGEFLRFLLDSGRAGGTSCATYDSGGRWRIREGATWLTPPFDQSDDHPVVCVSWEDAQAYVDWLNRKVPGAPYRLPTEAEWEYAVRAGSASRYPWGDEASEGCHFSNAHDRTGQIYNGFPWTELACDDGVARTAPAGSLAPNKFKLRDMSGSVWEWVADCWNEGHAGRPGVAEARLDGDCARRVLRGGSWVYGADRLQSAAREADDKGARLDDYGFRIARDL